MTPLDSRYPSVRALELGHKITHSKSVCIFVWFSRICDYVPGRKFPGSKIQLGCVCVPEMAIMSVIKMCPSGKCQIIHAPSLPAMLENVKCEAIWRYLTACNFNQFQEKHLQIRLSHCYTYSYIIPPRPLSRCQLISCAATGRRKRLFLLWRKVLSCPH